jgi:hypothetical protein
MGGGNSISKLDNRIALDSVDQSIDHDDGCSYYSKALKTSWML